MGKHTPGPWQKYERYITDNLGKTIAYAGGTDHGRKEDEANTRLIAAAPDLLEACRKASTCASIPDYVMDVIRAAIAKATE